MSMLFWNNYFLCTVYSLYLFIMFWLESYQLKWIIIIFNAGIFLLILELDWVSLSFCNNDPYNEKSLRIYIVVVFKMVLVLTSKGGWNTLVTIIFCSVDIIITHVHTKINETETWTQTWKINNKHGSNYWPHFWGGDSNSPCHDNRSTALAGEADKFWWSLFGRYMNDVDKTTFFTLYFTKLH